jgi:hypothetical protein
MRVSSPRWRKLLVGVLIALALMAISMLLARWSGGVPKVRFQPGDRNVAPEQASEWTFDTDPVGQPPPGTDVFSGNWVVQAEADAPTWPNVLCQRATAAFPALCLSDKIYTDVDARAHFKSVSGLEDQAAGIIFRVQDKDNYYIFRANALENNVMFFRYAGGRRSILKRGAAPVASGQWHVIRVETAGSRFRGYLNDRLVLETTDDTYQAGMVGLWTKADSVTCFDNARVIAK